MAQVAKDCLLGVENTRYWLEDLVYDTDEYGKRVRESQQSTPTAGDTRQNK